jgi:AcrR family transcriptional regulator
MGRPSFDSAKFLSAARDLACERGLSGVTVDSLTHRVGAPKGSFYYRFASRDALLGELWLSTVLAYQEGFVAAIAAGDGLAAALHTPAWSRDNLDAARVLLLHSRHDFVQGDWPPALTRGVEDQEKCFRNCLAEFAQSALGGAGPDQLRRAQFVLAEAPIAAVKTHLVQREAPPPIVDELISMTYRAIVDRGRSRPFASASPTRHADDDRSSNPLR